MLDRMNGFVEFLAPDLGKLRVGKGGLPPLGLGGIQSAEQATLPDLEISFRTNSLALSVL
jgi:hypothetical protein